MIRINLLPPEIIEHHKTVKQMFIIFSITGLILIFMISFLFFLTIKITILNAKLTEITKEIETYQSIITKLKEVEIAKEKLQKRLDVVKQIMKNQEVWPNILAELHNSIPETIWLDNFYTKENSGIYLSGYAFSYSSISVFLEELEKKSYFDKVQLENAISTQIQGYPIKVIKFQVNCGLIL